MELFPASIDMTGAKVRLWEEGGGLEAFSGIPELRGLLTNSLAASSTFHKLCIRTLQISLLFLRAFFFFFAFFLYLSRRFHGFPLISLVSFLTQFALGARFFQVSLEERRLLTNVRHLHSQRRGPTSRCTRGLLPSTETARVMSAIC